MCLMVECYKMAKYIGLADVSLSVNDEYSSGIDDIYLGIYDADTDADALDKVQAEWDKRSNIESLGEWVCGYDYSIK